LIHEGHVFQLSTTFPAVLTTRGSTTLAEKISAFSFRVRTAAILRIWYASWKRILFASLLRFYIAFQIRIRIAFHTRFLVPRSNRGDIAYLIRFLETHFIRICCTPLLRFRYVLELLSIRALSFRVRTAVILRIWCACYKRISLASSGAERTSSLPTNERQKIRLHRIYPYLLIYYI
jgi:hypothetical protein